MQHINCESDSGLTEWSLFGFQLTGIVIRLVSLESFKKASLCWFRWKPGAEETRHAQWRQQMQQFVERNVFTWILICNDKLVVWLEQATAELSAVFSVSSFPHQQRLSSCNHPITRVIRQIENEFSNDTAFIFYRVTFRSGSRFDVKWQSMQRFVLGFLANKNNLMGISIIDLGFL